jgi:hypothetical protein
LHFLLFSHWHHFMRHERLEKKFRHLLKNSETTIYSVFA